MDLQPLSGGACSQCDRPGFMSMVCSAFPGWPGSGHPTVPRSLPWWLVVNLSVPVQARVCGLAVSGAPADPLSRAHPLLQPPTCLQCGLCQPVLRPSCVLPALDPAGGAFSLSIRFRCTAAWPLVLSMLFSHLFQKLPWPQAPTQAFPCLLAGSWLSSPPPLGNSCLF